MERRKELKTSIDPRNVEWNGAGKRWLIAWSLSALLFGVSLQAQTRSVDNRVRILTFRLTANRISPATVSVPKGKYLIRVNNGVFSGPVTVDVSRGSAQSERIGFKSVPIGKGRESLEMELTPGQHTLRVSPRANWVALINVQQ
ncbi:MAG: hypothetical protein JNM66_20290 [Bryobacterales bacterium]|nr:hypothetical protein [Bryobacterales bacterium]